MISVTQSMVSNSIHANSIFKMPLFALFVEKLVKIFSTDETLVVIGWTAYSHRSVFFWRRRFTVAIALLVWLFSSLSFEPVEPFLVWRFSLFKLDPVDDWTVPLATLRFLGGTFLSTVLSEVPVEMSAVANRLVGRESETTTATLHAAVKEWNDAIWTDFHTLRIGKIHHWKIKKNY